MANPSQSFKPGQFSPVLPGNVKITHVSMGSINTEVSHALQDNLRQLMISNYNNDIVKLAYVSGESGTKYITIPPFSAYTVQEVDFSSKSIFVQSPKISTIEVQEIYL
jgi:hypothetical protein